MHGGCLCRFILGEMLPKANVAHGSTVDLGEVRRFAPKLGHVSRSWRSHKRRRTVPLVQAARPEQINERQLRSIHIFADGDSAEFAP